MLEILEQSGIQATFFVLGSKIVSPEGRALAARAHAAGHWIGNHTMTHAVPLGRLPDARARAEIIEAQALIGELSHPDRLFRPFGGGGALGPHLLSPAAVQTLVVEKMTCVLWNAVPRDWEDPTGWVETALAQCRAQPWSVLVLHDLPSGAMDRLDAFIGRLRAEGARFRQDFPSGLIPMRRGEALADLSSYVT